MIFADWTRMCLERMMLRRAVCWIMLVALIGCMALRFDFESAHAEPRTIVVPDDYSTIQEAINSANNGDTVYVRSGTYFENVALNKAVSLLGEDGETTIVDGNGTGNVITITAGEVVLSQFTVQNSALTAQGIWISSDHNLLVNNTIRDNYDGIYLRNAYNNTLRNNSLINNKFNLEVNGDSLPHFIHDIDSSNSVNGKPVYYLNDQNNLVIDSSTFPSVGYLALVNCENITVKGLNITQNFQGMLLANTTAFTLEDFNASLNRYGIYLFQCHDGLICDNNIEWSYETGIAATDCSNVTIDGNHMNGNTCGISLGQSNCTVNNNILLDSFYAGIVLGHSNGNTVKNNSVTMTSPNQDYGRGIWLTGSSNNTIEENAIASMRWAATSLVDSTDNRMLHNTVVSNGIGVYSDSSAGNVIYQNNLINNTVQIEDHNSTNSWDNGCEGNYWSNYTGIDANGDGIGDTAHIIDANNTDRYPLMNRYWNPSDINHDLKIDMKDIGAAARAFYTRPEDEFWNPHADITGLAYLVPDGKVDFKDIGFIARRFGEAYI